MKKLFFVAFAMIAMTFASCGNGKSAEAVETTALFLVHFQARCMVTSVKWALYKAGTVWIESILFRYFLHGE